MQKNLSCLLFMLSAKLNPKEGESNGRNLYEVNAYREIEDGAFALHPSLSRIYRLCLVGRF